MSRILGLGLQVRCGALPGSERLPQELRRGIDRSTVAGLLRFLRNTTLGVDVALYYEKNLPEVQCRDVADVSPLQRSAFACGLLGT
jgi:hypothetical protein